MVWLAQDDHLSELVALKFLPPQIRFDPAAISMLRKETSRSRKLSHPNIVRIHDFHRHDGEDPFIAMEYVDGQTLQALRFQQPRELFSWEKLESWVRQLCAALDYAHGEKIVHRDLKPANLMLDRSGRLKLADFGIATVISDAGTRITGTLGGTPAYMSPQQVDGKPPQPTDDIYSLGATLYELLTSTPPFHTGQIVHQVLNNDPDPPSQRLTEIKLHNQIPPDVEAMVMACLAKDAARRPQSARAIADWIGLQPMPHPQSLAATIVQAEESPSGEKHPLRGKMIWAAIVILLLGVGGWVWATKSFLRKSAAPPDTKAVSTQPPVKAETVVFADDFENTKAGGTPWYWDWEDHAGKSVVAEKENHFVRLEGNDAQPTRIVQITLPVRPEWKKLAYSVRMRTRGLKINPNKEWSGAKMDAYFLDEKKSAIGVQTAGNVTADIDWRIMKNWDKVPDGARYLRLDLTLYESTGIVDFDDVKVTVREQATPSR